MTRGPTVAVIGCGPAGMFLLHAIETHRKRMEQENDTEGLERLPIATCLERAPAPGGVWRAEREFASNDEEKKEALFQAGECSNMYEALWTNGAKELIEFYDYTFDDHFGGPAPVYLPRSVVLDYLLARVTRNAPTLLQDHVRYNTEVVHVAYDEDTKKFVVETKNLKTNETTSGSYDKCLWAAGDNGQPNMPGSIVDSLKDFGGTIIHSSDASDLETHVRDKRILLIGGASSAEDLALMAIKLGVKKVFCSYRSEYRDVSAAPWWPMDKVKVYPETIPFGVVNDGKDIELAKVQVSIEEGYKARKKKKKKQLKNIDTIIFCTGYHENYSMLEEALRPPNEPSEEELEEVYCVPPDWKMSHNSLTDDLGDVPVQNPVYQWHKLTHEYVCPGQYRGVLISNPSMMFAYSEDNEAPLQELEAGAWRIVAYLLGKTELPSPQEMRRRNNEILLLQLQIPAFRYNMDVNYRAAVDDLCEDENHWLMDDDDPRADEWEDAKFADFEFYYNCLPRKDGHYPIQLGCFESRTLTEHGKKCLAIHFKEDSYRELEHVQDEDERSWRTFRDLSETEAAQIESIFTGTKAIPLKKKWIDIDEAADEDMW